MPIKCFRHEKICWSFFKLERGLYCIEHLVDSLEDDQVESLLPSLLNSISRFLNEPNTPECQTPTIGVGCLKALILTAQESILPHLAQTIQMLQAILPKDVSNGSFLESDSK